MSNPEGVGVMSQNHFFAFNHLFGHQNPQQHQPPQPDLTPHHKTKSRSESGYQFVNVAQELSMAT